MEGLLGRKTPYEKAVLAWKKLDYEKECRRWTKGFYNEKEVLLCQEVSIRGRPFYFEKFSEECSIRKRTFYNEKEVPSGQRVLLRAGSSIIAKDILNMKRKLHYVKIALF